MDLIETIEGGFFTTVQDLGRYGYQRYGVPVSGAMDPFALRTANLLVGNPESAAGFEITLLGPRLRFLTDAVIAVTGADLEARLDERPVPRWQATVAPEGAVLAFGAARDGLRAYLAIAGGIDVPVVLGSRSTFTRGALGGLEGRALRPGDRIRAGGEPPARVEGRIFPPESVPAYGHDRRVRVVLGPQDDAFTDEGLSTFLSSTYVVSGKSDRIGCRLDGPRVVHRGSPDIVSDGVAFGSVQVAGNGLPMILLADRGTTGGYTKIATVISVDLSSVAQAMPGDRISLHAVSLEEAHRAFHAEAAVLERLARSAPVVFSRRQLHVRVNDSRYSITTGLLEERDAGQAPAGVEGVVEVVDGGTSGRLRVEVGGPQPRR